MNIEPESIEVRPLQGSGQVLAIKAGHSHGSEDGKDKLHNLDLEAEDRPLDEAELKQKRELRSEVWKLSRMMEWEWPQKSRLDWNLKGDRNTQFFHVTTSCRHNRDALNSISVGGVVVDEPDQVKQEMWDYFRNHFTEDWVSRLVLVGDFKSVSHSQCFDKLEAEFSEEEIWTTVKGCNGNKAPGPDGFNLLFCQKHWKMFKEEVIMFMKEFHSKGRLVNGLNCSLITLIPKKENASSLSGINILDGELIANEIVDGWRKSKKKGLLFKFDFEKVYDSINWEFLFSMLSNFEFGAK
ncbi:uncharacterized protein LOC114299162 [Camellia sinensis]|uniref:uncharacterized protein LOC114299162 n=1 Tax=Camellia sinensis TaxID=4442 RepID=UPI001036F261|nr:uncharacterized protein LOC114299162 [Camellia sinensis]